VSLHEKIEQSIKPRSSDAWRLRNAGRILSNAVTRFESRVLDLMGQAGYADTRLSHVNLTRHLDLGGTRITDLAKRARMTGAAMTELIDQCEGLGLVERISDPTDRRVRIVVFTNLGKLWLDAFAKSVKKAERELLDEIGPEAFSVLFGSLAQYASGIESIKSSGSNQ
jgi:DNA-binding MarR family transcriptional regulator